MSQSRTMHLAADLSHIHTDYLWRAEGSWIGYPYYGNAELYEDCARIASRGKFDLLFFGDSANWGYEEMIDHDERYVKAKEHMQVACKLWDSVEADALVFDRKSGVFCDP